MVIDFHTHIFPPKLAPRALAVVGRQADITPFTDGTAADLIRSANDAGIARCVTLPVATQPAQVPAINAFARSVAQEWPQLIAFGALHPFGDWRPVIDELVAAGFRGVKLHPDYQQFEPHQPQFRALYRALADASLIVLLHAGRDVGLPEPVHATPERIAAMLDMAPDLKLVAAHMGGWDMWDEMERHLLGRNCWLDTSYTHELPDDQLTALIRAHGAHRVMFGTDSPWTSQSESLARIRGLPLTETERDWVLHRSAEQLLASGNAAETAPLDRNTVFPA